MDEEEVRDVVDRAAKLVSQGVDLKDVLRDLVENMYSNGFSNGYYSRNQEVMDELKCFSDRLAL